MVSDKDIAKAIRVTCLEIMSHASTIEVCNIGKDELDHRIKRIAAGLNDVRIFVERLENGLDNHQEV